MPEKIKSMPLIGLGTWRLQGERCRTIVEKALAMGYRHIDTADIYQNHVEIGQAIQNYPRESLFITSKIYVNDLTREGIKTAVPRFLAELDVDYLDLLLIHWPNPQIPLHETIEAMIAMKDSGAVKNIGVSNFVRQHLKEIAPYHSHILTNQIELHPYFQRHDLVKETLKLGIGITAYRPIAKGEFAHDPLMTQIAHKHGKTANQIALRWLVQQNFAAIPKSSSEKHLSENLAIFDFCLDEDDMERISTLDRGQRFCKPDGMPLPAD